MKLLYLTAVSLGLIGFVLLPMLPAFWVAQKELKGKNAFKPTLRRVIGLTVFTVGSLIALITWAILGTRTSSAAEPPCHEDKECVIYKPSCGAYQAMHRSRLPNHVFLDEETGVHGEFQAPSEFCPSHFMPRMLPFQHTIAKCVKGKCVLAEGKPKQTISHERN